MFTSTKKGTRYYTIILFYFLIFSIGSCKLTWVFSRYLDQHLNIQALVEPMCEWTTIFAHHQFPQLLFFGLSLLALLGQWGGYYVLASIIPVKLRVCKINRLWIAGYFIFALVINIVLVGTLNYFYLTLSAWVLGYIALPIFIYKKSTLESSDHLSFDVSQLVCRSHVNSSWYKRGTLYWLITVGVLSLFLSSFYSYIFKPIQIANEFMDIPGQTILHNGRVVDNTMYTNQHHIYGLQLHDARRDQAGLSALSDQVHIKLPPTLLLDNFLSKIAHAHYYYDTSHQLLFVKGEMTAQELHQLSEIYQNDKKSTQQIAALFAQSKNRVITNQYRLYTGEEQEYIAKNKLEVGNKIKAGWFFFHHSWVLNPVLALTLGADAAQQVFLYGYGVAVFLKHVLQYMGGVSFQNYFKATFLFYPIYFLLFLATLYSLFRRADWVCLGAILLSISFYNLGYQLILVAPGYNPIRHLFDLPMLWLMFHYFDKHKTQTILLVILMAWFTLIWSKDFGLFLSVSCLGMLILRTSVGPQHNAKHCMMAIVGLIGVGVLYRLPAQGVNYNLISMLLGYCQPQTSTIRIAVILAGISFGYWFYFRYMLACSPFFWLALTIFFYLQFQLIYYIWYPTLSHFLVLTPALILGGMSSIYLFIQDKAPKIREMTSVLILTSILLYLPCAFSFYKERKQYFNNFTHHVVHHWNFQYGKFVTTMDPLLFADTLSAIERYAPESSFYLISKYDSILPTLAHRRNALPVVNLALDLLSMRDVARCTDAIRSQKPKYLFVDTDIDRDLSGEVMRGLQHDGYQESFGRFIVLKNMRTVYHAIQNDYQLLEKGALLSIYQRKMGI